MTTRNKNNIFLIGFMGTGKSTIGSYLAQTFHKTLLEMDEVIVQREGMSIPDIFADKGESYFRSKETALLSECQAKNNLVISCGGGTAMLEENVAIMKQQGVVILLSATPETIFQRVGQDSNRPVLNGRRSVEGIQELMNQRLPNYLAAADAVISTDNKSTEEISLEIIRSIESV